MAKIVRFLLILTTIFTLSFYLPSLYRRTVEKRPLKTMIYFSEVSRDFVIARETVDSTSQQGSMLYYDGRNNLLSETEYMQLLPFNNRRKLKLMGIMPDSLNGVELTTDVLKNVKRSMLIADRSFTYQIDPLFESEPERLGVTLPDDLFRIGKTASNLSIARRERYGKKKANVSKKPCGQPGSKPRQAVFMAYLRSSNDGTAGISSPTAMGGSST